jgi:hypothetical protein
MNKFKCNICKKKLSSALRLSDLTPLQNYYTTTEETALSLNKIDLNFIWCNDCFHFSVKKILSSSFDNKYNNELSGVGVDWTQLKSVHNLIKRKISDKSKRIIEVGCGRGALLELLSNSGFNNIQGYDPVIENEYNRFVLAEYWHGDCDIVPDLLILRHTLEEIPDLDDFLSIIKKEKITNIYIEITNISYSLKNNDPFSLYPECENLFTISSLSKIMLKYGYVLDDVTSFFDGNWAGCWFRTVDSNEDKFDLVKSYSSNILKLEKPIVLWGAGGRGSNILSFCNLHKADIEFVVDVNKVKIGKYVPPNGQKIISPQELDKVNPKTVIVSSKKFLKDIKSHLNKNIKVLTIDQLYSKNSD